MSNSDNHPKGLGPRSYQNFQACAQGASRTATIEVPLYSDARIIGEIASGLGPCGLLNPLRVTEGTLDVALVLRLGTHLVVDLPANWASASDLGGFSGTTSFDEIACLISLELGARFAAGRPTREFVDGGDPHGTPQNDSDRPTLPIGNRGRAILPFVRRDKNVETDVRLLPRLGEMTPECAISLIRAARAYRDAIWLAEAEPQLSWLLLLSALETAAVQVAVPRKAAAEAKLREIAPALVLKLDALGTGVTEAVAGHIAHLIKATARFLALFERFPPAPPDVRPSFGFQFRPWDADHLREALSTVYDWRSRALHAAIPFPPPMCDPPISALTADLAPCETVPGLAAHTLGGTWTKSEMPFGLHLFEHIARVTLLSWWASMLPESAC